MKLNFRRGSAFASQKAKDYLATVNPEDIKSVTVIRHAAIGDFMNIRPFLIELKKFFPNAQVTLSVNRSAMYGMPEDLIDNVHIMDKDDPKDKTKKTGLFYRIKQAKQLPPQDIIFDLTDSSMTLLLILFSKAKLKIGYPYRALRRWFYDIATLRSDFVVEAQSVIHMLNILGAKTEKDLYYGFEKKYNKKDIKQIVYFAGASVPIKCWEKDKFLKLIDILSSKYKEYDHIILQGIKDDEKFLEIYNPLKEKQNVKLQEVMSLDEVMQFLSNTRLLISNDTGIRNMAIATQTPTIGIFFDIPPFRYWPRESKHDCVFNIEYTSPSVEDLKTSATKLLTKLYS
jgi:ADP-heptose:LPS heptosyltransferase